MQWFVIEIITIINIGTKIISFIYMYIVDLTDCEFSCYFKMSSL